MQVKSLWLGQARAPVKTLMVVFVALTVVLYALLIGQRMLSANPMACTR